MIDCFLHCRSVFSLLRGCLTPEEICFHAASKGCTSAGMVDVNNFYGLPEFLREAGRAGIRPLAGVEIAWDKTAALEGTPLPTLFTAYVLNRTGFRRANEIISRVLEASRLNDTARPIPEMISGAPRFAGLPDHLTGADYDPVADLLINGWEGLALAVARRDVLVRLAERVHHHAGRRAVQGELYAAIVFNSPFSGHLRLARRLNIPPLAVNRAVYRDGMDAKLHRLYRAIDANTTVQDPRLPLELGEEHIFADPELFRRFYSAVPEALDNARFLAERGDAFILRPKRFVFPRFQGLPEKAEFLRLRELCTAGISRRYGNIPPGKLASVSSRLQYELSIIRKKGFAGYFLVVHDVVSRYPRTCGRGSSAASIVSYLLGITHVDPLAYNLFFERFLNMGRKDPPDIDVDFPWDEREKALRYVFEKYRGSSGMVADHITFGPRSRLRDPAKAFGIEEDEITNIMRAWKHGEADLPPYLLRAAERIRSIPRHVGTHPGGVIITPGPVEEYTHTQLSPQGLPVIAWEKDGTEEMGLVKIDFLGNRSLGVLRDTLDLINPMRKERGEDPVEWESFNPLQDADTRKSLEEGNSLGVFYVESPATRQLLKKMKTGDYEHLVVASSIIRPAANKFINEYVRRLHGGSYSPVHPALAETLKETHGIMVYQEDVARVCIALCGYTAAEADDLRKVLSKKDRERRLPACRELFISRGRARKIDPDVLEAVWEGILSFDGYSFCKPHSASYAMVSYRLAWLKRRYPLAFFASVINNGGGFYSRQVYLNEVRRRGFPILHPDVNHSQRRYTLENGSLRIGLDQVRETSTVFIRGMLLERQERGPFSSYDDFLRRMEPRFSDIRMLIRSGALDSIAEDLTRPEMLWCFFNKEKEPGLFSHPPVPACIGDYRDNQKLLDEVRTMDLIVTRHPVSIFLKRARNLVERNSCPLADSRDIPSYVGRRIVLPGVLVTGKEVPTKQKQRMCFVSFEDEYGLYETVVFPAVFQRYSTILDTDMVFLVSGKVEMEFDVPQIIVDGLQGLSRRSAQLSA